MGKRIEVHTNLDFDRIARKAERFKPDLIIGNSQGSGMAKHLNAPLIRVGFSIIDRIGGTHILHIGYRGAQQMFDTIVNCMIQKR